jgi:hypothetical protein
MIRVTTAFSAVALTVLASVTQMAAPANLNTTQPPSVGNLTQCKFVGRWVSEITFDSGQAVDDGIIEISDTAPPTADRVSVDHTIHGGPFIGYVMDSPDRIELQVPLDKNRVAHYNGVLVSPTRIEGRYFVTEGSQGHHASKRLVVEEGSWSAGAT